MMIASLLCLVFKETKGLVLEDALKKHGSGQSGKYIAENEQIESEDGHVRTDKDTDSVIKGVKSFTENGVVHQNGNTVKFEMNS